MKSTADSRTPAGMPLEQRCPAGTSVVLRYLDSWASMLQEEHDTSLPDWLRKTSLREGVRVFPLLVHGEVEIHILDETSLMHTGTFKSIDGCLAAARCGSRGNRQVVFESGGNNGTALAAYCQRVGIETFCFAPAENLFLLDSEIFGHAGTHLIAVDDRGLVKDAARQFARNRELPFIPEPGWRFEASMFRGFFIRELLESRHYDWLTQAISAAFGPIGIYRVLKSGGKRIGTLPRFLGVQQRANCPMYNAWKSKQGDVEYPVAPDAELLSKVMYDIRPQTHGTYAELEGILAGTGGDLTVVSASEFGAAMDRRFHGKRILELLGENGLHVTRCNGDIREKSGLLALAGLVKEIDRGTIQPGSRVLCSLSGGASRADGKARPVSHVASLADVDRLFGGGLPHG